MPLTSTLPTYTSKTLTRPQTIKTSEKFTAATREAQDGADVDVDVDDDDGDGEQSPCSSGTAFSPLPIATMFEPQFATWPMWRFPLPQSNTAGNPLAYHLFWWAAAGGNRGELGLTVCSTDKWS